LICGISEFALAGCSCVCLARNAIPRVELYQFSDCSCYSLSV
jgi:hypothetical protein